jgi:hypothetical protein
MATRDEMILELARSCLDNATEGDLAHNYLKHVTIDELQEVYMDDHEAYYAMLEDDDLEQRYKDYIDDGEFDFDEQMEDSQ